MSTNPGCQAHFQIAIADSFTKGKKNWIDLGDLSDGFKEFRFPEGSRGRLLFWKLTDASRNARVALYGFTCDYDIIDRN